jgi:hypothetical protein
MSKSPGIVLEHKSGEVRIRGLKWALPVALDTETKGRIKATIQPNKWTRVPDEIYEFLKGRFDAPRYTNIPDVEANERNPHKPGDAPAMTQEEVDRGFYIEFKERN